MSSCEIFEIFKNTFSLQNTSGGCFCVFLLINPFKVNVAMQQKSNDWFLYDGNINPKWVSNKLFNTFLRFYVEIL